MILVLLGTNDLFLNGGGNEKTIEQTVTNVHHMIMRMKEQAPQAEYVLMAPPTFFPEVWHAHVAMKKKRKAEKQAAKQAAEHHKQGSPQPARKQKPPRDQVPRITVNETAKENLAALRDAYQLFAKEHGYQFISLLSVLTHSDDYSDGIHPNGVGHQKLADHIWDHIRLPAK